MAGRRQTNLASRKGVYYFRGFLPRVVHPSARSRGIRVSLRTRDAVVARERLRVAALAFESLCGQLRSMVHMQLPDEDIRNAVQAFGGIVRGIGLLAADFAS